MLFSFFLFLQLFIPVWSSVSLIPPSTFPSVSASSTSSTGTSSSATSSSKSGSSSSASATSTQFPPLSTYTPCVTNCLAVAIGRVNCTSIVDVNCFCIKPNFPAELVGCIQNGCSDQVETAENLAQQFCNIASASPSLSFTPTSSSSSSSSSSVATSESASSTSTAPSTSTSSSNTSGAWNVGITQQGAVLGFGMSMLGMVLGAHVL